MILTHLPKLLSIPLKPKTPIHHPNNYPSLIRFRHLPIFSLFSSLAPTLPKTHNPRTPKLISNEEEDDNEEEQEPHIEVSIDKLFVPPETDISGLSTSNNNLGLRILKGSNIVLSSYASNSQVNQAEYVKSSVNTEGCPADGLPEFALVGRSNVGKSSLLNSLVKRRKLALTSKKPGKTQCINHFRINDSWYLVDLPGYGYASAPGELRIEWGNFTRNYFLNRSTLVSVFLLIDASIPAKKIDLEYASWLGQNKIPMTIVFTKCDKRKKKKNGGKRPEENAQDFQNLVGEFFETTPPWIMTSSVTNQGRDEILLHMAQLRNYWLKH